MSATTVETSTYSTSDIEIVMRKFSTDLQMIAESSGAMSKEEVAKYVHDICMLAKEGYLSFVDLTLLDCGIEVKAVNYIVNTQAADLEPSRAGGVIWPRATTPRLRIVLGETPKMKSEPINPSRLKLSWVASLDDISHSRLTSTGGRSFVSSGYGLDRKDYSK